MIIEDINMIVNKPIHCCPLIVVGSNETYP